MNIADPDLKTERRELEIGERVRCAGDGQRLQDTNPLGTGVNTYLIFVDGPKTEDGSLLGLCTSCDHDLRTALNASVSTWEDR
jgi:hypothetical protein